MPLQLYKQSVADSPIEMIKQMSLLISLIVLLLYLDMYFVRMLLYLPDFKLGNTALFDTQYMLIAHQKQGYSLTCRVLCQPQL